MRQRLYERPLNWLRVAPTAAAAFALGVAVVEIDRGSSLARPALLAALATGAGALNAWVAAGRGAWSKRHLVAGIVALYWGLSLVPVPWTAGVLACVLALEVGWVLAPGAAPNAWWATNVRANRRIAMTGSIVIGALALVLTLPPPPPRGCEGRLAHSEPIIAEDGSTRGTAEVRFADPRHACAELAVSGQADYVSMSLYAPSGPEEPAIGAGPVSLVTADGCVGLRVHVRHQGGSATANPFWVTPSGLVERLADCPLR